MDCSLPEYTTRSGDGSQRAQSEREKFLLTAHQFLVRVKRVEKSEGETLLLLYIMFLHLSLKCLCMCVEDGEEVSEGRHRKWERAELQARRSLGRLFGAAFKNNFFFSMKNGISISTVFLSNYTGTCTDSLLKNRISDV